MRATPGQQQPQGEAGSTGGRWREEVSATPTTWATPGNTRSLSRRLSRSKPSVKYPCCIDGKRACPPEDCGGPWGYGDFVEAIQNPKHKQHKEPAGMGRRRVRPGEVRPGGGEQGVAGRKVKRASMSPEIAQQVVFGITAVGAVVWLWSLSFLLKSAQMLQSGSQDGSEEPTAQKLLTGDAEVEGKPKVLATQVAAILAQGRQGPLKIVEKTDDRIVFERLNPGMGKQPPGRWFRRGEFRFTSLGQNRTRSTGQWSLSPVSGSSVSAGSYKVWAWSG